MGMSGQFHLLCLHIIAVVVVLSVVVVVGGRFPASRRLSVRHLSDACISYLEPPPRAARGPLPALPRFLAQGGVASFGAPCLITHPRVVIDISYILKASDLKFLFHKEKNKFKFSFFNADR